MGMSKAPGTRTMSICLSLTPWRLSASSAPRSAQSANPGPAALPRLSWADHWAQVIPRMVVSKYKLKRRSIIAVHITGYLEVERGKALQLLGRAQSPHALQTQILEDLRADSVGSNHCGAGAVQRRFGVQMTYAGHEIAGRIFRPQDHDHPRGFLGHAQHRRA